MTVVACPAQGAKEKEDLFKLERKHTLIFALVHSLVDGGGL